MTRISITKPVEVAVPAEDVVLDVDALVRSVGVNRAGGYTLFLGAGASITSGMPSAWQCIWEWKREIFVTNNPGLARQVAELSLPAARQKIQKWLDTQGGFPPEDSPDEYGFYIQRCYPVPDDRRQYFQEKVKSARPHVGYRVLAILAEAGLVNAVWSTNFDGLSSRACADRQVTPIDIGIDCQERLVRRARDGELHCVSLHGDYRYDLLKNTSLELQDQEAQLRGVLVERFRNEAVIVCGYSGRDASIMDALTEAYSAAGPGSLYWCGRESDHVSPSVQRLIETARAHGHTAYYVPIIGFDDLITRLGFHCLEQEQQGKAHEIVASMRGTAAREYEPFQVPDGAHARLIKGNAFSVRCPAETYQVDIKQWPDAGVWKWVRELTAGRDVVAVPFRGKALCLGTIDDIKDAFGANLTGQIDRVPLGDEDFRYEDSAVVSLLRSALVRSLAAAARLETDGKKLLWDASSEQRRTADGQAVLTYDAVIVFLRQLGGDPHIILKPTIEVRLPSGDRAPPEIANAVKLEVLGAQYNSQFNQALDRWRRRLFPDGRSQLEFPPGRGSDFRFHVRPVPVFAEIRTRRQDLQSQLPDKFRKHVRQAGVCVREPDLIFSDRQGRLVKDAHPVRGIASNRPFDYSLTTSGLVPEVTVGVVCPAREARLLATYLAKARSRLRPGQSEQDYVVEYPGFESAFGLPAKIPEPGEATWFTCPEPVNMDDLRGATLDFARGVARSIDALVAAGRPHVVIVFVPSRLAALRRFEDERESFDLHDFVKAHCVRRGVATQFIEEPTLGKPHQCGIWWWLAMSLYVKSMRTPFVVDAVDPNAAYVGLGFSLDRKAEKGKHVVLGCSHLYNANGEGLQYRLTRLRDAIIDRQGNPYMSRDDARRVGETVRQLFYESRTRLPERVVLHKLTPFRKDEREGLAEGLGGVGQVDMLEINEDAALRYVTSSTKRDGSVVEGRFPIDRGTTVQIGKYEALLWIHGSAASLDPKKTYYQGKRRIPAPLLIRRHAGSAPLTLVAAEILSLSKMNLNSFYLYTKLPVTVQSSNEIARIGSLLQAHGGTTYDYRLFI